MKKLLNSIPMSALAVIALFLALAPFSPEPHLQQKVNMLFNGSLSKPLDIFDLFLHSTPLVLLGFKVFYKITDK